MIKRRNYFIREAAVLRNSRKVPNRETVTIFDIDNEIKSKFLGAEKIDNDGQTCWVVDNPKAVLVIVYNAWGDKNAPLYKISIMRKAKIISAWEGIYLDEFRNDLVEASEDWDHSTLYNFSENKKKQINS